VRQLTVARQPSVKIEFAGMPSGIYVCRVTFENGEKDNIMIIKE